jgi:hypothetical protein
VDHFPESVLFRPKKRRKSSLGTVQSFDIGRYFADRRLYFVNYPTLPSPLAAGKYKKTNGNKWKKTNGLIGHFSWLLIAARCVCVCAIPLGFLRLFWNIGRRFSLAAHSTAGNQSHLQRIFFTKLITRFLLKINTAAARMCRHFEWVNQLMAKKRRGVFITGHFVQFGEIVDGFDD